jgi:hypothetical protein
LRLVNSLYKSFVLWYYNLDSPDWFLSEFEGAKMTATKTTEKTVQGAKQVASGTVGAPKADLSASCSYEGRSLAHENKLRLRAYQKWEAAGRPEGDGVQFWLEAEVELARESQANRSIGVGLGG